MSWKTVAAFGAPALILAVVLARVLGLSSRVPHEMDPEPTELPKACVVGQILASDGMEAFDPSLEHLRQRLQQPPLNVFNRFEFLASREFPCDLDELEMPLHGGGFLSLSRQSDHADHREWLIAVSRPDGSVLMRTRAAVYDERPLLIVTANGERKSVVIWVSA